MSLVEVHFSTAVSPLHLSIAVCPSHLSISVCPLRHTQALPLTYFSSNNDEVCRFSYYTEICRFVISLSISTAKTTMDLPVHAIKTLMAYVVVAVYPLAVCVPEHINRSTTDPSILLVTISLTFLFFSTCSFFVARSSPLSQYYK